MRADRHVGQQHVDDGVVRDLTQVAIGIVHIDLPLQPLLQFPFRSFRYFPAAVTAAGEPVFALLKGTAPNCFSGPITPGAMRRGTYLSRGRFSRGRVMPVAAHTPQRAHSERPVGRAALDALYAGAISHERRKGRLVRGQLTR